MAGLVRLRADALEWRDVDGEIVALDLRRSLYLAVNASGTTLWPSLVEGASREQLVERLSSESGIRRETAALDVDRFLAELAKHDLLER